MSQPSAGITELQADINRAVQNGASMMAEGFLFFVGAGLVIGESYRSSRKEGKRRDMVADRLDDLETALEKIHANESQDLRHLQER